MIRGDRRAVRPAQGLALPGGAVRVAGPPHPTRLYDSATRLGFIGGRERGCAARSSSFSIGVIADGLTERTVRRAASPMDERFAGLVWTAGEGAGAQRRHPFPTTEAEVARRVKSDHVVEEVWGVPAASLISGRPPDDTIGAKMAVRRRIRTGRGVRTMTATVEVCLAWAPHRERG